MSTTSPWPAARPSTDPKSSGRNGSRLPKLLGVALLGLALTACGGGGGGSGTASSSSSSSGSPPQVVVSWNASHQHAVNTTGGGYLVYYSQTSGFTPGDPGVQSVNVPYSSGSLAPTSTTLNLAAGTWFFRVQAYSALTAPTGTGGSFSTPSTQVSATVP